MLPPVTGRFERFPVVRQGPFAVVPKGALIDGDYFPILLE